MAILHRLMRYMDTPGEEVSGFRDRVLCLVGYILPRHQYLTVDVPGTTFHLGTVPVRVPIVAAINALVPTWDDPAVPLGPFPEDAPETELVRPHHVQRLPGYLAAIVLVHRHGVTVKVAYQQENTWSGCFRLEGSSRPALTYSRGSEPPPPPMVVPSCSTICCHYTYQSTSTVTSRVTR